MSLTKVSFSMITGSPANIKDFGAVGDGVTDDTSAIQAALNSGAAQVIVPAGTYLHGTLTLPTGVWLVGTGGTLKANATRYQIMIAASSENSAVKSLTFDATNLTSPLVTDEKACISTPTNGTLTNFSVENCAFLNIPTGIGQRIHAIQLVYGQAVVTNNYTQQSGGDIYNFNDGYFIVTNNVAKNSIDGGIAFNNDARGVIASNYIYKCDLGIGAGPEGAAGDDDHTLIISGNEIVACGDGINMGWFGYANRKGPRNAKIVGNSLSKCKRSGLRYDGSDPDWTGYITVIGNTINDGGSTEYDGSVGAGLGVAIYNCKYVVISNNTLHDNLGTDIAVGSGAVACVLGNAINAGMYADTGSSWCDFSASYGMIANNTAFGRRILIQNATGVRVLGNTLTVASTDASQGAVVVAATATETTISENNFVNCGNAVYLAGLSGWFANDALDSNKYIGCVNKVVGSPLPRTGDAYVECEYGGTVNSSGYFYVSHGTANNGAYVMAAAAFFKGNSGESIPMTLAYIDGGAARFDTGAGNAGRVCRAWIRYNKDAIAW